MDNAFNSDQRLLKESVERFIAQSYSFEQRKKIVAGKEGYSSEVWREFADMGLLAMPFDESDGGLGQGPLETMIVMQAFGRGLVVEPYLPTVILAGGLLRLGGSRLQRQSLIPTITSGSRRYAFAFAEAQGRYNPANIRTLARRSGHGYRITGSKAVVLGAPMADGLFVTTRTAGADCDSLGISIFYVESGKKGVIRRDYQNIDGTHASEIFFDDVQVGADAVVGELDQGLPLVEQVLDEATAAVCAEASGAMMALSDKTLDYARNRVAFGQPISGFQIIQHRLVDMRVACEYAVAVSLMATHKLKASPAERTRAVSAAKSMIGRDSRFVGQNAIQLHGAIAMTDDLDIGHYFKRLTVIGLLFGNSDHHLRRFWRQWRGSDSVSVDAGKAPEKA